MAPRALLMLIVLVPACGPDLTTGTTEADRGVVGGTRTYQRPEIGYTGNCTATLIRPNIAITAAHCWGYGSRESAGNYGWLRFDLGQNHSRRFTVERYKSFGSSLGANDVTLLMLSDVVPNDLVAPATLATEEPARGSPTAIWGYGCTNQSRQVGAGVKRMVETRYGATDNLCPGDSGRSCDGRDRRSDLGDQQLLRQPGRFRSSLPDDRAAARADRDVEPALRAARRGPEPRQGGAGRRGAVAESPGHVAGAHGDHRPGADHRRPVAVEDRARLGLQREDLRLPHEHAVRLVHDLR